MLIASRGERRDNPGISRGTAPMPTSASGGQGSPRQSALVVTAMLAMVSVPAVITLDTVRHPARLQVSSPDPTPHGYTWSLLLWIVPIVVIALWFLSREDLRIPKKAFWRTIAVLVPLGFGLDFFFASRFFVFPNRGATLQIDAPALGRPVPVEEYVFYLTGFIAVLLIYVWLDEFWLAAYSAPDRPEAAKRITRLVRFHPSSLVVGLLLVALGVVYKKFLSESPEGFPGYFTFLVAASFIPSAGFLPAARPFINWRAFSLTMFLIMLVSLLWEATLAIPYGWWGYEPRQMLGVFVDAWWGLPLEAVFVWIAVTYATTIVFEVVKLWQASGKKARHAFLGGDAAS
jgi:hypothetical protein